MGQGKRCAPPLRLPSPVAVAPHRDTHSGRNVAARVVGSGVVAGEGWGRGAVIPG